jgi:hypothetical protein
MMTRREFNSAWIAAPVLAAARSAIAQDDIAGLYDRAIVIDALANPGSMNVSWPPRGPLSQKQRDAIAASGITAINVTVSADFEGSVRNIALWQGEADTYPTLLSIVRRHSDIAKAKTDKTLGLMLGFQNTDMIERDLARLDLFYRLGIRIIQLTYNDRNLVGDGCLEPGNAGLSSFGREVVARMNELGVAVDLSHCGTQTTADGIAASTRPPLITHSGCREVFRHPRSKEDRELKAWPTRAACWVSTSCPSSAGDRRSHRRHVDAADGPRTEGVRRRPRWHRQRPEPDADRRDAGVREGAQGVRLGSRLAWHLRAESRPLCITELNSPRRTG